MTVPPTLHGYIDPSLPSLDSATVQELNQHAAKDLAKRSIPGGLIVLIALIICAFSSPIIEEYPAFAYTLFALMSLSVLLRFYTVNQILKENISANTGKLITFTIFIVNAGIWGVYVSASLYLYGNHTVNMIILMFTIGIGAGAATSLFIWNRLAQIYLVLMFLPSMIVTILHWQTITVSILFGLSSYFVFLLVQAKRANAEYWRSLYLNKLLQKQTDELRVAKEQAEKANQAKTDFLSSMSHELRTPLNAIHGFTQLLYSDKVTPPSPDQKDSLKHILKASDHLLTLINQVLDLAKIEAGKLELNLDTVDVNKIVHECLPLIETLAKEKGITLEVAQLEPHIRVVADAMRLKQVLINLLGNGIKYNVNGGHLKLDFDVDEQNLNIKITDTGIGIAEKHQHNMFQNFSRLGQENSSTEGSGVGLVITKNLLEEMGGSLDFNSVEGQGSCFWFELPLFAPAESQA